MATELECAVLGSFQHIHTDSPDTLLLEAYGERKHGAHTPLAAWHRKWTPCKEKSFICNLARCCGNSTE